MIKIETSLVEFMEHNKEYISNTFPFEIRYKNETKYIEGYSTPKELGVKLNNILKELKLELDYFNYYQEEFTISILSKKEQSITLNNTLPDFILLHTENNLESGSNMRKVEETKSYSKYYIDNGAWYAKISKTTLKSFGHQYSHLNNLSFKEISRNEYIDMAGKYTDLKKQDSSNDKKDITIHTKKLIDSLVALGIIDINNLESEGDTILEHLETYANNHNLSIEDLKDNLLEEYDIYIDLNNEIPF